MGTVRAAQLKGLIVTVFRMETRLTDFTKELTGRAIVFVNIGFRSIAAGTYTIAGDITVFIPVSGNRLDYDVIPLPVIFEKQLVVNRFVVNDLWKFINLELLIFGGVGVIERPLLEGNIFCDKVKTPANLFLLVLNDGKKKLYNCLHNNDSPFCSVLAV